MQVEFKSEMEEMLCRLYKIFLHFVEGLSLYSTQVATALILFDVVLAMLQSIGTKYETKKLIVISSLMILLKKLKIFFTMPIKQLKVKMPIKQLKVNCDND